MSKALALVPNLGPLSVELLVFLAKMSNNLYCHSLVGLMVWILQKQSHLTMQI